MKKLRVVGRAISDISRNRHIKAAENRRDREQRRLERTRHLRPRVAQIDDGDADDREREQRADVREARELVEPHEARERGRDHADDQRVDPRRLELRMHAREHGRNQPVARHRVEDPRLAVEQHEHHRRQAADRADLHEHGEPRQSDLVDRLRDRRRVVQVRVRHDADQHAGRQDVEHGADDQRPQDADRHVAARVMRLGCRRWRRPRSRCRRRRSSRRP